jgi:hypothetical protein
MEHPTKLVIIIVPLLTLCGKRVKQFQWPRETTIRIEFLNLARGNLNTRHVVTHKVTRATFPLYSRFMEQGHHPQVQRSMNHRMTLGHGCSCTHHVPLGMTSKWWVVCPRPGSIRYLSLLITIFSACG